MARRLRRPRRPGLLNPGANTRCSVVRPRLRDRTKPGLPLYVAYVIFSQPRRIRQEETNATDFQKPEVLGVSSSARADHVVASAVQRRESGGRRDRRYHDRAYNGTAEHCVRVTGQPVATGTIVSSRSSLSPPTLFDVCRFVNVS